MSLIKKYCMEWADKHPSITMKVGSKFGSFGTVATMRHISSGKQIDISFSNGLGLTLAKLEMSVHSKLDEALELLIQDTSDKDIIATQIGYAIAEFAREHPGYALEIGTIEDNIANILISHPSEEKSLCVPVNIGLMRTVDKPVHYVYEYLGLYI